MPRLIRSLPKYRKHRASGQAVVTLNGRDHYLGPHGSKTSKTQYDRLIAEFLSSGRSPSFGAPQHDLTVIELANEYRRYAMAYYGTAKTSEYHRIVRVIRPVRELYGRVSAADFGPLQFKAIRQRLVDDNLSRTYINEFTRRVVAMFKWGAAEGKLPAATPQTLAMIPGLRLGKTAARETEPVTPVDDAVVDATLSHLPDVVADMVRLQRLTGARPAEICIPRPCDLDRSGDVWGMWRWARENRNEFFEGLWPKAAAVKAKRDEVKTPESDDPRLAELEAELAAHYRAWERDFADDPSGEIRESMAHDVQHIQRRFELNASRESIASLVARTVGLSNKYIAAALADPGAYQREE